MQLTDFFASFNFFNLATFFIALIIFDAIGVAFTSLFKAPSYLRSVAWVWGLGIYVFIWFILHSFSPFQSSYIWITLIIIALISAPFYIKKKGPLPLIKEFIRFPFLFIFAILVGKQLFFLLSAPPYAWDELAYHFYSPARLANEKIWPFFSSGATFYDLLPRFLDTSYIIMFSITKTYATARLLHFLLFFSSAFSIAIFIKKNVSYFGAIIYSLFIILISPTLLSEATLGYVDVGASSLALVFFISFIDMMIKKKGKVLISVTALGCLVASIKYNMLSLVVATIIIGLLAYFLLNFRRISKAFKTRRNEIIRSSLNNFLLIIATAIIFGGYWYIKNFTLTGNPLYPLIFPCRPDPTCGISIQSFFGGFPEIGFKNAPYILKMIFVDIKMFYLFLAALFLSLIFSFKSKRYSLFYLTVIYIAVILVDAAISSRISGFFLRYFYRWIMLIPIALAFPFVNMNKKSLFDIFLILVYSIFLLTHGGTFLMKNLSKIYEPNYVHGYVRNYAMKRININDWIDFYFPKTNEIIKWCGENKKQKDVITSDPSLIWSSYEGLLRVFMVNCKIHWESPPNGQDINSYAIYLSNKYHPGYVISTSNCNDNVPKSLAKDKLLNKYFDLNQKLVCSGDQVKKNLYLLKKTSQSYIN